MEKGNLKVGDTVRRINNDHPKEHVKVGDESKIVEILESCDYGGNVRLEKDSGEYCECSHRKENLELVEELVESKFYQVSYKNRGIISLHEVGKDFTISHLSNGESYHTTQATLHEDAEEICKEKYLFLLKIWKNFHGIQKPRSQHLLGIAVDFQVVKVTFEPRTQLHLYSADNSIKIYGYSNKSKKDLSHFLESHGRKKGFRVFNLKGITTGFIHPELMNRLSYHLTNI